MPGSRLSRFLGCNLRWLSDRNRTGPLSAQFCAYACRVVAQVGRVITLAYEALAPGGYFDADAHTEHPAGRRRCEGWALGLSPTVQSVARLSSRLHQAGFGEVRLEAS